MPARRLRQIPLKALDKKVVHRDGPNQAALALNRQLPLLDRLGRRGGVDAEALMDTEPGEPAQKQDGGKSLPALNDGKCVHTFKFLLTPNSVCRACLVLLHKNPSFV